MKKLIILCFCLTILFPLFAHTQPWKVPQGFEVLINRAWQTGMTEIARPRRVKDSNKIQYGYEIFRNGVAQTMGFKPVRVVDPGEYYTTNGWEDIDEAAEVIRQPISLMPKYTVLELKTLFNSQLKLMAKPLLKTAREWIDYYTNFDSGNPNLALWQTYITDMKTAYITIRAEVHPTITDYDVLVLYIKCEPDPLINGWKRHLPIQPIE
uniref:Uncharacterized protein n=1 Tax=viral metagenome TaxID=1070528 RepID=A0A6M3IKQ5_9ZZZZ